MSVDIVTRKYFNQLRNGSTFASNPSDFTDFLQGSICEKIKCETTIDVWWKSYSQVYIDEWNTVTVTTTCTVTRNNYSFLDDGFRTGDTIIWTDGMYGTGTGTITSVNALTMIIGSFTGTLPDGARTSMVIWGTTSLTSIIFQYNLIENSEADNFISKIDGNTLSYTGSGLSAVDTTLIKQGAFNSWLDDGNVKAKTGSSGSSIKQRFIITHEFYITPFYLPSEYNDLQNGIAPDYLNDVASLKYIASYDLKVSLYNPNSSHIGIDSVMLGSVSWFDEHFNGFTPLEFNKQSIAYSVGGVAATELQINDITHVVIEINSVNNLFSSGNTNFILNLFALPIDDAEYINTITTMFENYLFDRCLQTIAGATGVGEEGIISNVVSSIISNRLHIEFDVTYSTAQKLLIKDKQYIISIITDDHTQPHITSNEVHVLCDYSDYGDAVDNPNLMTLTSCKFWEHPFDPTIPLTGTKDFKGWITDGIYNETQFTCVGGVLNFLKVKVIAKNISTLEEFDLMKYNFDLSAYPIISGQRVVSINTTRGFKLVGGSIRNLVYLLSTGNNFELKFGFKLRWEDWIQLLAANSDFYNILLLNKGLSQKWSNYYDTVANWELKILIIPTIEDDLTGFESDFNITSNLNCNNFFEDGLVIPQWTGSIETFKGATSLGVDSNAIYASDTDTKIIATFVSTSALLTASLYGIIYLESYQQGGIYNQWQISTEELPASNNWLKPVTGQTKCKLTIISANTVQLEAMIDSTKVNGSISIAARIGYGCQDIAEVRAFDIQGNATTTIIFLSHVVRYFDLTINGTAIVTGQAIPSPYDLADIINEINLASSYEAIWELISGTSYYGIDYKAPVGTGSSANGDTIELILYNAFSMKIYTMNFTLSGGVDGYICPTVILPTYRIQQEDAFYLLQETGDYLLYEP